MGKTAAQKEVIQALVQALRDRDPDVRQKAAEALRQLLPAHPEALRNFLRVLPVPMTPQETQALKGVLRAYRGAVPAVRALLSDPDPKVRAGAVWALGVVGSAAATPKVIRALLSDPDPRVRAGAVWALGWMGKAAATPEIIRDLLTRRLDEAPNVRTAALEVLRKLPVSPETVSAVLRDIRGDEPEAGEATAWALERLG